MIQPPTMPTASAMTVSTGHEEPGEQAWHDQLTNRIGAERAKRDLIGDDHRAELGGHARSDASSQHQAGQHRAESSLTIDALMSRPTNSRARRTDRASCRC